MSMCKFTDLEMKILDNFSDINSELFISPTKIEIINVPRSVVATYEFDTPHSFEGFGVYSLPDFLSVLKVMDKPEFDPKDGYLDIVDAKNSRLKYKTQAESLLPVIMDMKSEFALLDEKMKFSLSADRLAVINKMANILKSAFIFFETKGKKIQITVGDELENSLNNFQFDIEDGIKLNQADNPIKIPIADFKVQAGEYEIVACEEAIKFTNLNNVVYYIKSYID
jgi:hypothetical protein